MGDDGTIAVTGPLGVFGAALIPALERDPRVRSVVGVGRRPFDPADRGWHKLSYRQGDVRDRAGLADAFAEADAVAHLAFAKFGYAPREEIKAINLDGSLNALRAAGDAGVRRFVFASSAAAYGFRRDNPELITEERPAFGSEHWFYSREKAELEEALTDAARDYPELELSILRPSIVIGPETAENWDEILPPALRGVIRAALRLPGRIPVPAHPFPLQFVHEADVAEALRLALIDGPAGVYNIAGEGTVPPGEFARELGLLAVPVPRSLVRGVAGGLIRIPGRPAALEMAEVLTAPVLVDADRARRELGWSPRYTSAGALRAVTRGLSENDSAWSADAGGRTRAGCPAEPTFDHKRGGPSDRGR